MELLLATAERLSEEDEAKKEPSDMAMDFGFLNGVGLRKGTRGKQRRRVALEERQLMHLREAAGMDEEHMVAEALFDLANMGNANAYGRGSGQEGYYAGVDDDGYAYEDGVEEEDQHNGMQEDGRVRHPADGKRHRSWHHTGQHRQQHTEPADWRVGSNGGRRYSRNSYSPEPEFGEQRQGMEYVRGHSTRGRHAAGRRSAHHTPGGPAGDLSRPAHVSKPGHHKLPGYVQHDFKHGQPGQAGGRKGEADTDVHHRRDVSKVAHPGQGPLWPGANGLPEGAAGPLNGAPGFPFLNAPGMAAMLPPMSKIVAAMLPNGIQMPMLMGPEGQMLPLPGWLPGMSPGLLMHPGVALGTPQAGPPGQVIGRPAGPPPGGEGDKGARSQPAQSTSTPPTSQAANQPGNQGASGANGSASGQPQPAAGVPLRGFAQGLVQVMGGQPHAALPKAGLPGRRKGCLSHVHIAHFIMQRQQAARVQQQQQQQGQDGKEQGESDHQQGQDQQGTGEGSSSQPKQQLEGTGRSSTSPTASADAAKQEGEQSSSEQQDDSQGAKHLTSPPANAQPSQQPQLESQQAAREEQGTAAAKVEQPSNGGQPAPAHGVPVKAEPARSVADGGPALGTQTMPPALVAAAAALAGGPAALAAAAAAGKWPPGLPMVGPAPGMPSVLGSMPPAHLAQLQELMPPGLADVIERARASGMGVPLPPGMALWAQLASLGLTPQLISQLPGAQPRPPPGAPPPQPFFIPAAPGAALTSPGAAPGPINVLMMPPGAQLASGLAAVPQLPPEMLGVPLGGAAPAGLPGVPPAAAAESGPGPGTAQDVGDK